MGRWDAPSDLDYLDEPWERHERCATVDCVGIVSRGSPFIYCVKCLMDARDAERLRQQREQVKAGLVKKTEVA